MVKPDLFENSVKCSGEQGMALVTSLLILLALSLIGVTAMTNTTVESMISGNDYRYQQRFYAADGVVELALASIPVILSDGLTDQNGSPVDDFDSLFTYDAENDGAEVGNITPLIYLALDPIDVDRIFKQYDRMEFSIFVSDDDLLSDDENDNLLSDANNKILLTSRLEIWNGEDLESPIEETEILVNHLKIDNSGAAMLLENNGNANVDLGENARIIGGTVKGISTTDTLIDITYNGETFTGESAETNIPDEFLDSIDTDQHLKPTLETLQRLRDHLIENVALYEEYSGGTAETPIIIDDTALAAMDVDLLDPTSILYLQGYFELQTDYAGMIIIEEYVDPIEKTASCGLIIDHERTLEGLAIILLNEENAERTDINGEIAVDITLEGAATIDGMLITSSQPHGTGVDLNLMEGAAITYSSTNFNATKIDQKGYVVDKWAYISKAVQAE
jgi:hypothetical protein